ncbi:NAD(P)-dependent oxidoreductase [Bifidobacterium crudilactis]|jgi:3-hydroxyisobutyrate dehydrogenase|uniref:NAD(P)-dependent oxidoreductase n=2 Tax=Bifidobacterium TaxID=1678 RepID=A0A971ID19_9BIFI|nr:NAD(P)-dependent oxidoreductase [Bifidobacterium crudilactis]MCI1868686.1 NAD(P)-dependent oxidoreductase [Bifidobacterium crudilactis]MDN5972183.1 NAD(P)-dependent oxidoreductase [Bifidobacterium crudilactis]MDN6000639.1 NAD(P)-dependent oxidoreductase [Bifidobacterium crudilactis]MDN6208578.1 NAD(P)-dependent oxidoreductase [Bifidobacterium crudilactis]MDN6233632.1 NAD(P)-dependent oxidoreductase [Bifidobacterium crudilactis]
MNITVLGTGIMGGGIATVAASKGFSVTAWNRTVERAQALEGPGLKAESELAAAVSNADVIAIVVFDAASVMDVLERSYQAAPADAVWIQMSTIGTEGSGKVREFAGAHDLHLIETMMMGSKDQANSSQLILIGGGEQTLFEQATPFLDAISKKLVHCGPRVGDGTAVKLACNLWLGCITAAACQSVKVLERQNVDPQLFLDVIAGGTSDSPYAHIKGGKAITKDYSPQFEVSALEKDLGLMKAVMDSVGFRNDLLSLVMDLYAQSDGNGHAHDDISAVATSFE